MLRTLATGSSHVFNLSKRTFSTKPLFTAQALVKGARADGVITSNDQNLNLRLALPKEMGGKQDATNPEQLFAAGYAACFQGAMGLAAKNQKANLKGSSIDSKVSLVKDDQTNKLNIAVAFNIKCEGVDKTAAEKIVKEAHTICPYSNATRGNIEIQLNVV